MNPSPSLATLLIKFLEYLELERNASRLTIRNYGFYLTRFKDWLESQFGKDYKITNLNAETVRAYRLYLSRQTDNRGEPLKKSTQSYYIIAIRSFLKWLIRNDYPVLAPEKIEIPKADSHSLKFLNAEQVQHLLNQPKISSEKDLRDKAILETLFSTGLRVSELSKLDIEQINFKTREFGVIGKGRRARVVFLSERAGYWIERYVVSRKDNWKPLFIRYAKEKDEDPDGEKMRLTPRSIQRIVKRYVKRAKIPVDATTHTLRHSFATDLLSNGADLRSVQELLGHKNVATTQIYTHITNPQLKKVHSTFHLKNEEDEKLELNEVPELES